MKFSKSEDFKSRNNFFRDVILETENRRRKRTALKGNRSTEKDLKRKLYIEKMKKYFAGFEFDSSDIDDVVLKQKDKLKQF